MTGKTDCGACGARGVLYPATPSCRIVGWRPPWVVVEKCDACERFEDDLGAALSRFRIAGWFRCEDGGDHVLADSRTELPKHGELTS